MTDNTYWVWTDNFDGTADQFKYVNGVLEFEKKISNPPNQGIDPTTSNGIRVNIKSYDSPRMVKKKVKKALAQSSTKLEG